MSNPKDHENYENRETGLDGNEQRELEALRASYRDALTEEPSELLDARIRKLAHDELDAGGNDKPVRKGRQDFATWTGLVTLAATIGFAVVLVPTLLVEEPAAPARSAGKLELRVQETPSPAELQESRDAAQNAALGAAQDAASLAQRERQASESQARMLAATPPSQDFIAAEEALAPTAKAVEEAVMQSLNAATANGELDMESLRAELALAPEPEWRATLVALRDSNRRPQAEELLPDYRSKFDLPETLTLDQLVVASQE